MSDYSAIFAVASKIFDIAIPEFVVSCVVSVFIKAAFLEVSCIAVTNAVVTAFVFAATIILAVIAMAFSGLVVVKEMQPIALN